MVPGCLVAALLALWLLDGLPRQGVPGAALNSAEAPAIQERMELTETPEKPELKKQTPQDTLRDEATWRQAEVFPATREYQGPDFELDDQSGETIRLSDNEGRIVVLNLWATWCPPCRDEVPALIRLQNEYGGEGVQVIGVSLDENGARQAVGAFAESFGVNYPMPVDDGSVQEKYGPLSVIPTTYILDRRRNIRFYAPGYMVFEQMEEAVLNLLMD